MMKPFDDAEYLLLLGRLAAHDAFFHQFFQTSGQFFSNSTDTLSVSRVKEKIYFNFNEKYWSKCYLNKKLFLISHEILHIALEHLTRFAFKNIDENVACDLVVNHLLVDYFGFDREDIDPINQEGNREFCWIDNVFRNHEQILRDQSADYYLAKLREQHRKKPKRVPPEESMTSEKQGEPIIPEAFEDSEVPEEPTIPEVPEEPIIPEVPQESTTPEVPEEPTTPEVPEEPIIPEVPQESAVPEVPQESAASREPEGPISLGESGESDELGESGESGKSDELGGLGGLASYQESDSKSGNSIPLIVLSPGLLAAHNALLDIINKRTIERPRYRKPKPKFESVIKNWTLQNGGKEQDQDSWLRPSRYKNACPDVFIPGTLEAPARRTKIFFFQDISGSCIHLQERFRKVAEGLDPKKFQVEYFVFDDYAYHSSEQFGNGWGTSFSCIEQKIQEFSPKEYPKAVFIITDGYGDEVEPALPERWHWFLTQTRHLTYIPPKSKYYPLANFE